MSAPGFTGLASFCHGWCERSNRGRIQTQMTEAELTQVDDLFETYCIWLTGPWGRQGSKLAGNNRATLDDPRSALQGRRGGVEAGGQVGREGHATGEKVRGHLLDRKRVAMSVFLGSERQSHDDDVVND